MSALKLYAFPTPNGLKVSVLLELLGLKYEYHSVDIRTNVQKEDWFLALNPNGRIPTLVDSSTNTTLSESGAILQYLVDTYDKEHKFSYPYGSSLYYKQLEVLLFQMAGVGPMQGQFGHFSIFAQEKVPYGIERYGAETKRLYSVVELYLERNKENGLYLVGDRVTIADIAIFTWARGLERLGVDIKQWPLVSKWFDSIDALPEVQKGLNPV